MIVHTARVWYRGEDRLDITRMTGGSSGTPFAPSLVILEIVKRDKRAAVMAHDLDAAKTVWDRFRDSYLNEMHTSQWMHFTAWRALLARERVVLVCYCPTPEWCHRGILADVLVTRGATYGGELETER